MSPRSIWTGGPVWWGKKQGRSRRSEIAAARERRMWRRSEDAAPTVTRTSSPDLPRYGAASSTAHQPHYGRALPSRPLGGARTAFGKLAPPAVCFGFRFVALARAPPLQSVTGVFRDLRGAPMIWWSCPPWWQLRPIAHWCLQARHRAWPPVSWSGEWWWFPRDQPRLGDCTFFSTLEPPRTDSGGVNMSRKKTRLRSVTEPPQVRRDVAGIDISPEVIYVAVDARHHMPVRRSALLQGNCATSPIGCGYVACGPWLWNPPGCTGSPCIKCWRNAAWKCVW